MKPGMVISSAESCKEIALKIQFHEYNVSLFLAHFNVFKLLNENLRRSSGVHPTECPGLNTFFNKGIHPGSPKIFLFIRSLKVFDLFSCFAHYLKTVNCIPISLYQNCAKSNSQDPLQNIILSTTWVK